MKKIIVAVMVMVLAFAVVYANGFAQQTETPSSMGVKVGQKNIGGSIGLWHGIGISISGEMIFKDIPDIYGIIGLGGEIGYASYERKFLGVSIWDETYIPIFGFVSYHYKFSDPKIDPYVRLGLGFVYVSADDIGGYSGSIESKSSYIDINGQVGVRYALTPNLWARAAAGTPWILSVGIDFMLP